MSDNDKSSLEEYYELLGQTVVSQEQIDEEAAALFGKEEKQPADEQSSGEAENTDTDGENVTVEGYDGLVDIQSSSGKKGNPFKRLSEWYNVLPKKKKIIVSSVFIFICLVIILLIVGGIFVADKFSRMGKKIDDDILGDEIYEEQDFDEIDGDVGAYGFKDSLKEWYNAGSDSIMSSKNVINVLLVGADSRKGTNSGNTDVMMLVSINKKSKEIKLVSFFRDSYLYIEDENGSGHYGKLNSAFSLGGPEVLMKTIEKNYKINIDNFIMVNFESFKDLIDAMGGVTVDVQKYEADYVKKRFKFDDVPYGEDVTLNGKQALGFCRSRNCDADGDVSRTRRQRQVISAIIDKVQKAKFSELNKYVDTLLPYLYTGYSKSEILTLGMKAYTGKWMNFERKQLQMPPEEARTSGYAGSAWIWVVDYQLAAQLLQTEIYGKSNITLADSRRTLIDIYRGVNSSGSYSSGYSGSSSSGSSGSSSSNTDKPGKTTEPAETTAVTGTEPIETTENAVTTEPQEAPEVSESAPQETKAPEETEAPEVTQGEEPVSEEPHGEEPVVTEAPEPPVQPEEPVVTEAPEVPESEAA